MLSMRKYHCGDRLNDRVLQELLLALLTSLQWL